MCQGRGTVRKEKVLEIKIPAGVDTGSRLRLSGEGEAGPNGGPPGDLYVFISVKPHDLFHREGDDVICQLPISFIQATLGDKVRIPTLTNEKELVIPKGTQHGELFRFRKEGIPSLRNGQPGDQIIQVTINTPTNISKKQEALLRDFAKLEKDKLRNKLKNILKGGATAAN